MNSMGPALTRLIAAHSLNEDILNERFFSVKKRGKNNSESKFK